MKMHPSTCGTLESLIELYLLPVLILQINSTQYSYKAQAALSQQIRLSANGPLEDRVVGGSPRDVSEEPVMYKKRKEGWRMSCVVGKATVGLEYEL